MPITKISTLVKITSSNALKIDFFDIGLRPIEITPLRIPEYSTAIAAMRLMIVIAILR